MLAFYTIAISAVVALAGCFFTGVLLVKRLNPIFDPQFATLLNRFVGPAVPSRRFGRMGMYAVFAVFPRIRERYGLTQDLRTQIDPRTYRLCRIYVALVAWASGAFLGAGLLLLLIRRP